ncbi:MAG: hypothetical protein COA79_00945 [Planctomycetota bacterium]|nr:MAG: hypothetical protein COA79_00945 [Planctomycetota bacterium]
MTQIKLENDFISVKINDKGAELVSLYNKINDTEYLWQADPKYWARNAPILFPIVGKILDNKINIKGQEYEMGQHGFARDLTHHLKSQTDDSVNYLLHDNEITKVKYPYSFELNTAYSLLKNGIQINYKIRNPSEEDLYFSFGNHPAFNWPLNENNPKNSYYLEFEKKETANRIWFEDGFITGEEKPYLKEDKIIKLHDQLFINDVLIFKNLESNSITLKSDLSNEQLKVSYGGYEYMGIWTTPGTPFVCIEPWCGIADNSNNPVDYENKLGVQKLSPGNDFNCHVSYTFN